LRSVLVPITFGCHETDKLIYAALYVVARLIAIVLPVVKETA